MVQKRFSVAGDRRDYFRIDATSIVRYTVVENNSCSPEEDILYQQRKKKLTLKAKLENMTREMQPIHKLIASRNSKVARYLAMIDQKLDIISDHLVCNELCVEDSLPVQINLSAGGISFESRGAIMSGSMLELEIVLLPENSVIFSKAKVISCVKKDKDVRVEGGCYRISVEFIDMEEAVRDLISRHVITREIKDVTGTGQDE